MRPQSGKAGCDRRRIAGAGLRSWPSRTDVTDEAAVAALIEATMAWPNMDASTSWSTMPGAFDGGLLDKVSLEAWNNVIGACLTGTFLCSRQVFSIMREAGGGRIINIGSISAQRPREGGTPYAAAKFGVWGLTQAIALDGRPFGISSPQLAPASRNNVLVEPPHRLRPEFGQANR